VLGSLILSLLPELLRAFKDFRLVVNGVILMVIVLFLPKGIWDPARFARWFGIKRGGTMPSTGDTRAASNESH
jgi:branched-chain amino acid transport system permease protein